jgi:protein SCO1/2
MASQKPASGRRFRAALAAALALLAAGAWLGWVRLHAYRPFAREVFADPQPGYNFQLTDQNGRPVRLDSFRGKVVLLTFGFTHCPNVCPTTLANLSWALNLLPAKEKARVQVLFVSVDPRRDTPERLRGYIPFYNPAFLGASGSVEETARTAKSYGVFYAADAPSDPAKPDSYNITHSAYVYVIDQAGRWVAMYDHDQLPEREKIAADLAYFAQH